MNIVAIGGGELHLKETLPIDRFIVSLTKKRRPLALLIPTASGDSPLYPERFSRVYGELLGCRTEHLLLIRSQGDRLHAERKIREAALIYVGGGNTLRMMKLWRRLGIDEMLRQAARRGTVLSGLSAGGICWHEWGDSDSRRSSGKAGRAIIRVRGLGLCPGTFCPHLDSWHRHADVKRMVFKTRTLGIGCDENAAVWYHDAGAACVSSLKRAKVHLYRVGGRKVHVECYSDEEVIPIAALNSRPKSN
jgi:dipeptidase E